MYACVVYHIWSIQFSGTNSQRRLGASTLLGAAISPCQVQDEMAEATPTAVSPCKVQDQRQSFRPVKCRTKWQGRPSLSCSTLDRLPRLLLSSPAQLLRLILSQKYACIDTFRSCYHYVISAMFLSYLLSTTFWVESTAVLVCIDSQVRAYECICIS